ncbi:MAG TPA: hypothetical protein VLG08_10015 [Casimicrobiaceae bacterium]|jgi:hypothetical protein|nr:hypothetical protein [Casimicrobiaceae bacterium]
MLINGRCHCGNIAFVLEWDDGVADIPARACGCTFCVRHGGVWTSNGRARLEVSVADPAAVSRYEFGTRTATFHVCTRCGVVPVVTSDIRGRRYAVVNANAFEGVDPSRLRRSSTNFDDEDADARLARRERNWIPDVRFAVR